MIPTVEYLTGQPQDLCALAAGVCHGRTELRDDESERRLLRRLLRFDPPHLTVFEHARFLVETPRFGLPTVEALVGVPGLRYRPRTDARALLSVNLSHVRRLALGEHPQLGVWLASMFHAYAPDVVGDLIPSGSGRHPAIWLLHETELTLEERREFPVRSFRVTCSRAVSHEIARHRTLSIEQESQRAVGPRRGDFIWPPGRGGLPRSVFTEQCALDDYDSRVETGWKREDARYVLPNAAVARLILTGDMTAWRHFLTLRGARAAMHEVRYVALLIRDHLAETCPEAVEGIDVDTAGLGPYLERREACDAAD